MQAIQTWAAGICAGCVLVGVLQTILPKQEQAAVIKNVLMLYILLSILTPLRGLNASFELPTLETGPVQAVFDTEALQRQALEEQLSGTLARRLESAGIQAQVDADIQLEGGEVRSMQVYAAAPTQAQQQMAESY